jgi:hypothetical protein
MIHFSQQSMRALAASAAVAALTACGALNAQQPPHHEGGHKPPPEAIEACKSLKSGDDCSFSAKQGQANGNCWAPDGKPLACKPKKPMNEPAPAQK